MSTRSPVTCSSPVRIAAPLPRFCSCVDDAHRAVAELAEHVAGAVGAAVVDDDDLALERELDGAHAAHDLDDRVALVVHGHDHRQLAELRVRQAASPILPVPVVGAGEALARARRPDPSRGPRAPSVMSGRRCRGRRAGSGSNTISDCEPVTSSTASASSSIVNSSGLPMFIGPTCVGVEQREEPARPRRRRSRTSGVCVPSP